MKYKPQFRIRNAKLTDENIRQPNTLSLKDLNLDNVDISEKTNCENKKDECSERCSTDNDNSIISRAEDTLFHIKNYITWKLEDNKVLHPKTLAELIKQWEFDYEMDKEYQPESLIDRGGQLELSNRDFYEKTGG